MPSPDDLADEFLSEEFGANLPNDDLDALKFLAAEFKRRFLGQERPSEEKFIDAYYLILTFIEERQLNIALRPGDLRYDPGMPEVSQVQTTITAVENEVDKRLADRASRTRSEGAKLRFAGRFGKATVYELSDAQLHHIQQLVNELRDLIAVSGSIADEHK